MHNDSNLVYIISTWQCQNKTERKMSQLLYVTVCVLVYMSATAQGLALSPDAYEESYVSKSTTFCSSTTAKQPLHFIHTSSKITRLHIIV